MEAVLNGLEPALYGARGVEGKQMLLRPADAKKGLLSSSPLKNIGTNYAPTIRRTAP